MLRTVLGTVASTNAVDLILLGVLLEAVALFAYWRQTGKGIAPRLLIANLASGGSLMLALRFTLETAVLAQNAAGAFALCLAVALAAHIVDLAARWDHGAPRTPG
jgi:peptidoglycan/LPS O-acetylase OafA/YrhL